MKRLLLLRHAKASPDGKQNKDRERILTARGRADAAAMGAWMHINAAAPDVVLCSDATRTAETWEIVAQELDAMPRVAFVEPLYLAPSKRIQAIVREAGNAETVLVVGHNSGIEECAADLARKPASKEEAARLEAMREKYPTCALAVLEFDIADWSAMTPGSGALVDFVRPRDLDE
jgi:phosphohistidine phosphatase